jgi:4-hydroxy-tetrahydrodipicolinate synthase
MTKFRGAITALVTPFKDGTVDYGALRGIVDWQVAEGVHGFMVCGTTGENPALTADECVEIAKVVKQHARGLPVIAGINSPSTSGAVELARRLKGVNGGVYGNSYGGIDGGIDGLLVAPPQFNRPSVEGLYRHYQEIASVGLPVVVYNIPQRGVINMSAELICRIARISGVTGLKDDDPDMRKYIIIRRELGPGFNMLSGCDYSSLAFNAQCGDGCISVISNVFPGLYSRLQQTTLSGDFSAAAVIDRQLAALYVALYCEVNPVPVKYAMKYLGRCSDEVRLPLLPASEGTRQAVGAAIEAVAGVDW